MKKPKKKRIIIISAICFVYVSYVLISQQIQTIKYNKTIKENHEKIVQQQREIDFLAREKQAYKSDEYMERVARERLGYVKPGEKIYKDKSVQ